MKTFTKNRTNETKEFLESFKSKRDKIRYTESDNNGNLIDVIFEDDTEIQTYLTTKGLTEATR